MAMVKYARASIVQPRVTKAGWAKVRTAASAPSTEVSENLIARASEIFGEAFDPKKYLLTHATIVASVDTYQPSNAKLGSHVEDGFRVNRKYGNYRVHPKCDKFINNNLDGWERGVLLKSFPTFIGGHNFVEHVQLEERSKGRIIDAVARDVGDSVYIDILIATDRKHVDLVAAIESGKMGTLSMGCTVDGTVCTKCGHWAADETEMCPHIKYEKGNTFYDEQGQIHRVAELCGHVSIDPDGGVQFIEGSWVGTPAFVGAVLRNIVEVSPETPAATTASNLLAVPAEEWSPPARRKAAALVVDFMAGWDDGEEDEAPTAPESPKSPFGDVEDALTDHMKSRVRQRLRREMDEGDPKGPGSETPSSSNETLVKEGSMEELVAEHHREVYGHLLSFACRTASNDADLLDKVAQLNAEYGVSIPVLVYRAAATLGSRSGYSSEALFNRACHAAFGRAPTPDEFVFVNRLGKLISRRGQARCGKTNPLAVATTKENVR